MKLCRFELRADPGTVRSGILHADRLYETDGQNAIGIHELGDIRLLPPVGTPPSVRVFDARRTELGAERLVYWFANPTRAVGAAGELPLPDDMGELDFEVRIATTVTDAGERIEESEAERFILGMAVAIVVRAPEVAADEIAVGSGPGQSADLGFGLGPWLVTPDDVRGYGLAGSTTRYAWPYKLLVNGLVVAEGIDEPTFSLADLLRVASQGGPVLPGELLLTPALAKPSLSDTEVGRGLLPGDRVEAHVEGVGVLVLNFAV